MQLFQRSAERKPAPGAVEASEGATSSPTIHSPSSRAVARPRRRGRWPSLVLLAVLLGGAVASSGCITTTQVEGFKMVDNQQAYAESSVAALTLSGINEEPWTGEDFGIELQFRSKLETPTRVVLRVANLPFGEEWTVSPPEGVELHLGQMDAANVPFTVSIPLSGGAGAKKFWAEADVYDAATGEQLDHLEFALSADVSSTMKTVGYVIAGTTILTGIVLYFWIFGPTLRARREVKAAGHAAGEKPRHSSRHNHRRGA